MQNVSPGDGARPHTQSHTQGKNLPSLSPSVKVAREKFHGETDPMRRMWDLLDQAGCSPEGEPHDFVAICPAHQGERRNLGVTEGADGRVLLNCLAHGCDWRAITSALGVDGRVLFRLGHKKGKQRGYHEKPTPVRSLSKGAAFLDALLLAGFVWRAMVVLPRCPYCDNPRCLLWVHEGGGLDVECPDGCLADGVRRAVETRAAIAEKGVTL